MSAKGWLDLWPTNTGGIVGGPFEEREEDLLATLRAGPGAAARQEVAVGERGPAPRRWTLRTSRAPVEWPTEHTLSGGWRVLHTWGLGVRAARARLFSPDPEYRRKVQRLHHCLRDAARHPRTVMALFLDACGYQRWPEVALTWGDKAAVAQRAGTNQQWRTIGALNALTGRVNYLDGDIVGRQQVIQFYGQIARAYPTADLVYVIQDNWNIHPPPDVLAALTTRPQIRPVGLPTHAPWLKPIEKRWRWVRQAVLKMHRWGEDGLQVKQRVRDFLEQFAHGSQALLRYVGLLGEGKLATAINTS